MKMFFIALSISVLFIACPNGNGEDYPKNEDELGSVRFFPRSGETRAFPEGTLSITFDSTPVLADNSMTIPNIAQTNQWSPPHREDVVRILKPENELVYIDIYEQGNDAQPVDRIVIWSKRLYDNESTWGVSQAEGQRVFEYKGPRQHFTTNNRTTSQNMGDALTRVEGNTLYITPHHDKLTYGKTYYVVIPPEAITNQISIDGEVFTGIGADEWTFTTRAAPNLAGRNEFSVNGGADLANNNADFRTVWAAMSHIGNAAAGEYTVNIAPGEYYEMIFYDGPANNSITLNGMGSAQYGADVVLKFLNHAYLTTHSTSTDHDGTHGRKRAAFFFTGMNHIVVKNIEFRNLDDHLGGQAEALEFGGPATGTRIVYNSGFFGHQDTILTNGRVWFYRCYIEGDTDYIWGSSSVALFEESILHNIECRSGHLFAARVQSVTEGGITRVPKGYVVLNSTLTSAASAGRFGRTQANETRYDQAAIISSEVGSGYNPDLWGVSTTIGFLDGGTHVGYKVYGLTNPDGAAFNVNNRNSETSLMTDDLFNREYNGRHAILNRHYVPATGRYLFTENMWDISAYELAFNATEDPSRQNDFDLLIPVEEIWVDVTDVTLAPGQSRTINFEVRPLDASDRRVSWESSAPTIVSVTSSGVITGLIGGDAVITISALDDSGVSEVINVTVNPNLEAWSLHWGFTSLPAGWNESVDGGPTFDTAGHYPDADLGNGFTLLAKTGARVVPTMTSADLGTGINATMQIDHNPGNNSFVPPFTTGRIRLGQGTFAQIDGIQGPYTITINFAGAGGQSDRFPVVKIGSTSHNLLGSPGHVPSEGGSMCQLKVNYDGTDSPVIFLKMNGGARVWDVYIEGIREIQ